MNLASEFKRLIKQLPKESLTNENFDKYIDIISEFKERWGIDVEWKDFKTQGRQIGAWNIDMGIGINDFLRLNPDIQASLINKYKNYPLIVEQLKNLSVSRKSILGLNSEDFISVGDSILDEVIKATKTTEPTAFVGHRTLKYGRASADFKNSAYRGAAMEGRLTSGPNRFRLIDDGGILHMPNASTTYPGTREEYRKAAQRWRSDNPNLKGFKREAGTYYENGQEMLVRNAAKKGSPRIVVQSKDVKVGTDKAQLESGRIQAPSTEEIVQRTAPPGSHWHHKRVRGSFKPFFKDLDPVDSQELADYTARKWASLGDVDSNLELLEDSIHNQHHGFLKDVQIQVDNKSFPDFSKADLPARKQGIDLWFEYMQPAVDENLESLKATTGAGTDPVHRTFHRDSMFIYGESFPDQLELRNRVPKPQVNPQAAEAQILADRPALRAAAEASGGLKNALKRAGSVLPFVGAGLDTWDAIERYDEMMNNPNEGFTDWLDKAQFGIASATVGTSFWAEPANFALGMTNLGIDAMRTIFEKEKRDDFGDFMNNLRRGAGTTVRSALRF